MLIVTRLGVECNWTDSGGTTSTERFNKLFGAKWWRVERGSMRALTRRLRNQRARQYKTPRPIKENASNTKSPAPGLSTAKSDGAGGGRLVVAGGGAVWVTAARTAFGRGMMTAVMAEKTTNMNGKTGRKTR